MSKPETILPLDNAFRRVLNSHGYAFHYSVIRTAERLHESGKSAWIFEVAEFPVSVQGKDTRIDIVFRRGKTLTYIIAECKRVNPALGDWCFVHAPYTRRNPNDEKLLVESLDAVSLAEVAPIDPQRPYKVINSIASARSSSIYHIGLELKSDEKGEKHAPAGRGAIEEAAGQVLRGMNGMVEYISSYQVLKPGYKVSLVPVIFTTAKIHTSELDLGAADLEKGIIVSDTAQLKTPPWIWLNYNQSQAMKHSHTGPEQIDRISDVLENEYVRSIAIVSATGIEDFLWRCEF